LNNPFKSQSNLNDRKCITARKAGETKKIEKTVPKYLQNVQSRIKGTVELDKQATKMRTERNP
jgi:hypothetical protein